MKEVTQAQFKEAYFKYGKAEDGWDVKYWEDVYENASDMKYCVQLPENEKEHRMMIVNDYSAKEYRLFFLSVNDEENLFRQS